MTLVSVSRQLVPSEHKQLRTHIGETNRLGDLSIKWHGLGKAAVTILEQAQYQRVITKMAGILALTDPVDISKALNDRILRNMPSGNGRITADVTDVAFLGGGPFSSIAYSLDCPLLAEQREYITRELDMLNGSNAWWGSDFMPHLTIATIPRMYEDGAILDKFWDFAPELVTLEKAIARP